LPPLARVLDLLAVFTGQKWIYKDLLRSKKEPATEITGSDNRIRGGGHDIKPPLVSKA
jgi:hypothetical protein